MGGAEINNTIRPLLLDGTRFIGLQERANASELRTNLDIPIEDIAIPLEGFRPNVGYNHH